MSSRRARRRRARSQSRHSAPTRDIPVLQRLALAGGGLIAIAAGVALLTAGGGNAARLSRVAGILFVIGVVCLGIAVWGKL